MNPRPFRLLAAVCVVLAPVFAARPPEIPINYDEGKVPAYRLPDPLVAADGSAVRDAAAWRKRRLELLEVFSREVYGRTPSGRPAGMHWETTSVDRAALGGKAVRKEITVWFTERKDGPRTTSSSTTRRAPPARSGRGPRSSVTITTATNA